MKKVIEVRNATRIIPEDDLTTTYEWTTVVTTTGEPQTVVVRVNYDKNGFPDFANPRTGNVENGVIVTDTPVVAANVQLSRSQLFGPSEGADFGNANRLVQERVLLGLDGDYLSDVVLEDGTTMRQWFIDNGSTQNKIPGWTWHHHQNTGRMQLVRSDVHGSLGVNQSPKPSAHLGGSALWGGSARAFLGVG